MLGKDHEDRKGGGVLLAARNGFVISHRADLQAECELLFRLTNLIVHYNWCVLQSTIF